MCYNMNVGLVSQVALLVKTSKKAIRLATFRLVILHKNPLASKYFCSNYNRIQDLFNKSKTN